MTAYQEFIKHYETHREEAEQLAGRFEFENDMPRKTAESRAVGILKDKYNLWGKM